MNAIEISNKMIVKKRVIHTNIDNLWSKWTTRDGLNSFFSVDNDIELRPMGKYEIYFSLDVPYGSRGSEGCQILSFIPNSMLSFTWNTPPALVELRDSGYYTWVVIDFKENKMTTEITLTHLGWPMDPIWEPAFSYFDKAWDYVLDNLLESLKGS